MTIDELPGLRQLPRELHFYWILDNSRWMEEGGSIHALNEAVREAVPSIRYAADDLKPRVNLVVHAIEFNDGARWVNGNLAAGVPGSHFGWPFNLKARGQADMGKALEMVSEELWKLPQSAFRPVLCLVTNGKPTDQFSQGLKTLLKNPWGEHAFRIAIAIGGNADVDVCNQFIANRAVRAFTECTIPRLNRYLKVTGIGSADGGRPSFSAARCR